MNEKYSAKHLIEDQMRKKKKKGIDRTFFFQFNSKLFSISRLKKKGGCCRILAVPTTPNNSESTSF